ncbi:MATE family efflux transporter [Candidatus Fermentibacteria bacterium]|nr:MATE family efflux transporter [Candidatus Fermentibacteria bacterium]
MNGMTEKSGTHTAAALVRRGVGATLFNMAFPLLAGTVAMNAYSLTDTWFVSRLGTQPLAAMAFSFPVVMLLSCVAAGIGNGVMTLVSHSLGRNDHRGASRMVGHGAVLMLIVSTTMAVLGYLSIDAVFTRLGADASTRRMVGAYMRVWYLGAFSMAMPMMGNGILISAGDSRMAGRMMMLGPLLNLVLDPVMIFGYFGFPALGLQGAALATVISQVTATVCMFLLLLKKHRLVVLARWPLRDYLLSWRRIATFAAPNILSLILMPISSTVITRILGGFGNEAVAAAGAAGRIEMFAFVIPMALGISLTPFVSQNYGAARLDRIRRAIRLSVSFALLYGGFIAILFFAGAPWFARAFSKDPKVVGILVTYVRTISFGYGMMEVHRYSGFVLTGLHKPALTTTLNAVRVVVVLIPLSLLGAHLHGVRGLFVGRLITDLVSGCIGLASLRWVFASLWRNPSPRSVEGR